MMEHPRPPEGLTAEEEELWWEALRVLENNCVTETKPDLAKVDAAIAASLDKPWTNE